MLHDEYFGGIEPMIDIECSDHCFQCIREDIGILVSLGIVLATRELDGVRK